MEIKRRPFQGVFNIIRFNWHYYLIASLIIIPTLTLNHLLPEFLQAIAYLISMLLLISIFISLVVSCYVYDFSNLYKLDWLPELDDRNVLSINAGFDETSSILMRKFEKIGLTVCDFFDPNIHTEISIKRARKAYPPIDGTMQVSTSQLPFEKDTFDYIVVFLSAHEIRSNKERIQFIKELKRVINSEGQIIVTEHLRDLPNFLAYNLGFTHFHSRNTWLQSFKKANLQIIEEIKTTPFITTFKLAKDGNTL